MAAASLSAGCAVMASAAIRSAFASALAAGAVVWGACCSSASATVGRAVACASSSASAWVDACLGVVALAAGGGLCHGGVLPLVVVVVVGCVECV